VRSGGSSSSRVPPTDADGFLTRGNPVAVGAVRSLVRSDVPHAILLVGPQAVGKTTLALDIAAALLCTAADRADRPCRSCRGCRLVATGNHPDLHRLAPSGPGGQIVIGEREDPEPGSVRHLIGELALLPVEGGARVAVVEEAQRLNEHAQNALLKTLEEPPAGVTIVLCAIAEDGLLPTVLSRCVRIRLGPVGPRDIEVLLAERGAADAPTAARLARIAGGRPGLALAYARAPEAVIARHEIARSLLDLLDAGRAARLVAIRELQEGSAAIVRSLTAADAAATPSGASASVAVGAGGRARRSPVVRPTVATRLDSPTVTGPPDGDPPADPGREGSADVTADAPPEPTKASAAERRRAALVLLDVWRSVARDLLVAGRGGRSRVSDPSLIEELEFAGRTVERAPGAAFLSRLDETARLIEGNANPELALDVLVLAWSRGALA